MGVLSNKISRDDLKPGDHIYSWRAAYLYAHHGIYAGKEQVIHFTVGEDQQPGSGNVLGSFTFYSSSSSCSWCSHLLPPCLECGNKFNQTGVISSCLDCFLRGGELYRFEYGVSRLSFLAQVHWTCTQTEPDPQEEVLHRANFLLKKGGFGVYDILNNNCEDFVIYCKTGYKKSEDVPSNTSFGGLVLSVGMYWRRKFISNIGARGDMMKVPVEEHLTRKKEKGMRHRRKSERLKKRKSPFGNSTVFVEY